MALNHRCFALTFVLILASLEGCASTGAARGAASAAEPDNGTIIVRPTFQGFKYVSAYSLLVRKAGTKEDGFPLKSWSVASDGYWARYYDDIERGELVALSIPAGEYEIHGWSIIAGGWGGLRTSTAKDRLAYRFRVEAGKAVYLGNLHVAMTADTGITPAAFTVSKYQATSSVRDMRARDFAELPALELGIVQERVEVRLLR